MADDTYLTYMGNGPDKVVHWEHWSCPDAETYLTGIDYYEHPRECRLRLRELYPQLNLPVPETDTPKARPVLGDEQSSDGEHHSVRWGDSQTGSYEHGESVFKTLDQVLEFSPLENPDYRDRPYVIMNYDYTSEETLYDFFRQRYPADLQEAPAGVGNSSWFYNTIFMWPMLTFGWELFLEACLEPEFDRIMDEFAEMSRRVFKAMARLPVNFVICHDDIMTSRGPVCSPNWMNKYIFPRYEEYWSILKSAGKEVIFMVDGNMDAYADDVIACGARGIISEPFTDYKAIARKHENVFLAGEGDNRILSRNNPEEIRAMVESMVETAQMSGGYMMCIGNHIPWNIPPEAIKLYLDLSNDLAYRACVRPANVASV